MPALSLLTPGTGGTRSSTATRRTCTSPLCTGAAASARAANDEASVRWGRAAAGGTCTRVGCRTHACQRVRSDGDDSVCNHDAHVCYSGGGLNRQTTAQLLLPRARPADAAAAHWCGRRAAHWWCRRCSRLPSPSGAHERALRGQPVCRGQAVQVGRPRSVA